MPWYTQLSSPLTDGGIEIEPRSFPTVIGVRGHSYVGKARETQGNYLRHWGNKGELLGTKGNLFSTEDLFKYKGNLLCGV